VFALIATAVVFVAGLAIAPHAPVALVDSWGKGFWELLPFTMQMALIIITGYVLASSRPVAMTIARLTRAPRTARGATVMVAVFSMLTSWFNWGAKRWRTWCTRSCTDQDSVGEGLGQGEGVRCMARAHGAHAAQGGAAMKVQVSDEIEELVARGFVG
jgi:hypothetical protein